MNLKLLIPFYGILGVVLALLALAYFFMKKKQKKTADRFQLESKKNTKNHLYFLTRIYLVTPIIKSYYLKIKSRYATIFPADELTLTKKTTERMTFCLSICIGIMVITGILCAGNIPYLLASLLACYILFTNMVNTSQEKLQMKILDQLDTFISELHGYFHETGRVEDALQDCLDELPYEISLHANQIYNIVSATDVEEEVEKYVNVAPNKYLLLLAAICATVAEYGDKKLENGKSLFSKNLIYLKTEVNAERIRLQKRVSAFSGKVKSVLVPIFALKPIELFMAYIMPESANFYKGAGGLISLAIIIVTTFICYEAVNALKDDHDTSMKEEKLYKIIAEVPFIKKVLNQKTDHNYSKAKQTVDMLKATGNTNGINVFTVKRLVTALAVALLVNVICIAAIHISKTSLLEDFSNAYTSSLVPSEEYRTQMQMLSESLGNDVKKNSLDEAKINESLISQGIDQQHANMILEELSLRNEKYNNMYYKAYMLILSVIAGVVGYNVPYWLLKYKKKIMGMGREDEVAQFRTLILILMHEDGMRLDTILEWMERFAHSFKASITDCIVNLEYSEKAALEKMRDEESGFPPFRRLCESMLAVDNASLEGAFSDLETDREYYQDKRKEDNEEILKRCSKKANFICMIPVYEIIAIYLFVPFIIMVINMAVDFGKALS